MDLKKNNKGLTLNVEIYFTKPPPRFSLFKYLQMMEIPFISSSFPLYIIVLLFSDFAVYFNTPTLLSNKYNKQKGIMAAFSDGEFSVGPIH